MLSGEFMSGLFITGTDTGVGKTRFTSLLARALIARDIPIKVSKPIATGAKYVPDGDLLSDDTLVLGRASQDDDLTAITPYCFETPANPALAARLAGKSFRMADLVQAVRNRQHEGTFTLVEGVGGLMCPLTETETIADFARTLNLPIIIVARRSLGTLNHLFLTLQAAKAHGLKVAGIIMSETEPAVDLASRHNPTEFALRSNIPILAVLPHETSLEAPQSLRIVESVDWLKVLKIPETISPR
jgi:dethiobiotin synthetase